MPSSLSTPSFGITEIEKELERIDEEFLSTPSLGITATLCRSVGPPSSSSFQLPLSGSQYILKTISTISVTQSFNSLSRDHTPQFPRARLIARSVSFNSLSRDHLAREMWLAKLFDDYFFQLPLSGSRGGSRVLQDSPGAFNFQLPLSGSQRFRFPHRNGEVLKLSTPSLGITFADYAVPGMRFGYVPFNSLSRDHTNSQ